MSEPADVGPATVLKAKLEKRTGGNTTAIAYRGANPGTCYVATQNTVFKTPLSGFGSIVDCRKSELVDTHQSRVTEWTSYHAEMIVLSAILKERQIISGLLKDLGLEKREDVSIRAIRERIRADGGIVMAADADCCSHCGQMLDNLGIARPPVAEPKPGNTGWWNPLTDLVLAHAHHESSDFKSWPMQQKRARTASAAERAQQAGANNSAQ